MNNAEQPAQPIIDDCISTHNQEIFYGLTKREYFAGLAMQGMLANNGYNVASTATLIKETISYADELLKALEENK